MEGLCVRGVKPWSSSRALTPTSRRAGTEPRDVPTWNYMVVHAYGVPGSPAEPVELYKVLDNLVKGQE